LYISKSLRDIIPREEVWEMVNQNRRCWSQEFKRASLFPISWEPKDGKAGMSAILVMQRVDGTVGPIQLCYIYKKGDLEHPDHYHVGYVHGLGRLPINPDDPEAKVPPRYKKYLSRVAGKND